MDSILGTICQNWRFFLPFSERLGYIGYLNYGNLGDDAMYAAFRKMFPACNVLPFKYSKKTALCETLLRQKLFDAVCLGGGTFINADVIRELKFAQDKYNATFVFGSGAMDPSLWGSVEHRPKKFSNASEWTDCLRKCWYVGVRGPLSKQILESNGYAGAEILGDIALSLSKAVVKGKERKKKLGINISPGDGYMWGNNKDLLDAIEGFTKVMIEKKWQVEFYSAIADDARFAKEIAGRLGKPICIHPVTSFCRTINLLEDCDVFIGEKLHSTILAMCAYTPSIMLEYQPKCRDFMLSMGMEKFNMRTDRLHIDNLIGLVEELYQNIDFFQESIVQKTTYYKRLQAEKASMLFRMICQKSV